MAIKYLKCDWFNLRCAVNVTYIWILETSHFYKDERSHYLHELLVIHVYNGNILDVLA